MASRIPQSLFPQRDDRHIRFWDFLRIKADRLKMFGQLLTHLAVHEHVSASTQNQALYALARKYPNADREWAWQFVFPASSHYTDTQTGIRHHLHESVIQKAMAAAVKRSGLSKPATPHTLRHSFATARVDAHYDIRTIQQLLGHKDVQTTMIYTHVLNKGGRGVQSPADRL